MQALGRADAHERAVALDRADHRRRRLYDALVAAAAGEHGITLATRDRRAAGTYRALDIGFELIDSA